MVVIGKLWTPVQAVAWGMWAEGASAVYANNRVLKTHMVRQRKVEEFHRTFGEVLWALKCRRLPAEESFCVMVEGRGKALRAFSREHEKEQLALSENSIAEDCQ